MNTKAPNNAGRGAALLAAALAATLIAPATPAAPLENPVEVTADQAVFEQNAGTGVYRGDAELIQGNRHLYADVIRLFTENKQLVRVEATGDPVRMNEGSELEAHAKKLIYDLRNRQLVLIGDAYVKHQGNTFEGARVQYNLDSRRVDASSEGDKRVRLVIPASNAEQAKQNDGGNGNDDSNGSDNAETP